jgi:Zinc carboxypeptidase
MKRYLPILFFIMNSLSELNAQDLGQKLLDSHVLYQEKLITKRRFGHKIVLELIEKIKQNPMFEVSLGTQSSEGRGIFLIKCGKGKTKVMLWSQMHGDESTATMALFDILNFFQAKDGLDFLRKQLLENCTFYIIPMLNPDGAEAWSRYTSLGIDMNRDALALQTPEGRFLKTMQQGISPDFGFNLHDKMRRYSAGETGHLATISYLATAYDQEQNFNETRKKAAQVIVAMNRNIQQFLPKSVGKWPSDFEPRAFGDNIQKWGTSLILVESGGYKNDPEKMYIRKLNFVSLLTGFQSIAEKSYQKEELTEYNNLPLNSKSIFDIIIRNATLKKGEISYKVDIAINREEKPVRGGDSFVNEGEIEEIGDMSVFFGTDEIDATGMEIIAEEGIVLGAKGNIQLVKNGQIIYKIEKGRIIK